MADDLEKRKAELAGLTEPERAELARFLLDSLDPPVDSDAEAAWDAALARRADEIQGGTAVGKPADQVFGDLRARYAREHDPEFLASPAGARRQVERGETISHGDLKKGLGRD